MTGFGFFSLISGVLQLTIPGYALRLVRRFGTQRVGWFLVAAFASLALLHLVKPLKPATGLFSGPALEVIYALASTLLVVGMGHLETLFTQRQQAEGEKERLRANCESQTAAKTASLTQANLELRAEVARREQTEKALRESEAQYRFLFLENPQPMWIIDLRSLVFLAANDAALRQYGYSRAEFMALTAQDLLSPALTAAFLADVAKPCAGVQGRGIWQHFTRDRMPLEVEVTSLDMRYVGCPARLMLASDVSSRRQAEAERSEVEKRELAGRLAGGVAHHFNNVLSVIGGHTSLLNQEMHDQKTADHLRQISAAVNRAAGLSRQLVLASGQHAAQLEPLDLNRFLQSLNPMLRRLVGQEIDLQQHCGPNLPPILADAHLVELVLVNLVLNARDAMPTGGTLTIRTAVLRGQDCQPPQKQEPPTCPMVRLSVRDTGCGIAPEVQARIFEPFFTTHEVGRGTGLGLASVYGVMKQHSGWVEFTSAPGAGTEFRTFFPAAPLGEPVSHFAAVTAGETILLVEPDDRARAAARFILNRQGFRVVEADCSGTALALWESQTHNLPALLLTNVALPGELSGRELADRLREKQPALKVVFSAETSTSPDEPLTIPAVTAGERCVSKPYAREQLLEAVQASLGNETSATSGEPA